MTTLEPDRADAAAGGADRPVVLVIDDERSVLRYLRALLEMEGFDVYEALNAPIGLGLIPALEPAVVVLDVMMPGMDGVDACARIVAERPQTPVVILTARDDADVRRRAAEAGAAAFLTKPLLPGQLPEAIGKVLAAPVPLPST